MSEIEDVLALSPLQEGLFSLARFAGENDLYNMQFVIEVGGPVDVSRLRASVELIFKRHANLRATFWDENLPRAVQIIPTEAPLPWREEIVSDNSFDSLVQAEARRSFDFNDSPLLRILFATLPDQSHRMVVTAHHILMDGWSLGVFFRELFAIYDEGGHDNLPLPRPYRDFIGWLNDQDNNLAIKSWEEYLGNVTPLILAERQETVVPIPVTTKFSLNSQETEKLVLWAKSNGLTLNTVVQFLWAVLLGRITDRDDILFGTTISGRPEDINGIESMIGLFINTIPVRIRFNDLSIVEQCRDVQKSCAPMRDIGYLSLSSIQRNMRSGELFDTLFVFENSPVSDVLAKSYTKDGTWFRPIASESLTHYPLAVVSYLLDNKLWIVLEEVTDILPKAEFGERLLSLLRQLPEVGNKTISSLELLFSDELGQTPQTPGENLTVPELFALQVRETPDSLALTTSQKSFTYKQLAQEVGGLAKFFIEQKILPEDVIALLIPRSELSVIAILAALSVGAAYVPIDPTLPQTRIDSILQQVNPRLIFSQRKEVPNSDLPTVQAKHDQSAYIIFTSGSTGEPKGVIGTHGALASYFADHKARVYEPAVAKMNRKLRIAHAWSMSFDASWQPLLGLLDGHHVHLLDTEQVLDGSEMVTELVERDIDMIDTTPSMFIQLRQLGLLETNLSVLALGGESISSTLWEDLASLTSIAVYNCYGPTEATVEAFVSLISGELGPNIGLPVDSMVGNIFDSHLNLVPNGVVGELYLSGNQLTRGYIRQYALTCERFVANPFCVGERMYRTGDLVRRLPSGSLQYVGRADSQYKIRGYRVEVGEIESILLTVSGVRSVVVTVVERKNGPTLVAFIIGILPTREHLAEFLPRYMIPAHLVSVNNFPITRNGKLDVTSLIDLFDQEMQESENYQYPTTKTEQILCEEIALATGSIAPELDSDLSKIGIDSISAISLSNMLRKKDLPISPRMIMLSSTIRELAAEIDAKNTSECKENEYVYGEIGDVPIVKWMHEYGAWRRLSLNMLLTVPSGVDHSALTAALQILLDTHDMLRSQFVESDIGCGLITREPGSISAKEILSFSSSLSNLRIKSLEAVDSLNPTSGDMLRAVYFDDSRTLFLCVHHLVIDPVSWHIIIADLRHITSGSVALNLLRETTSYRRWAALTRERAMSAEVSNQKGYWIDQVTGPDSELGSRLPDPRIDKWGSYRVAYAPTSVVATSEILSKVSKDFGMREFLLSVLTHMISHWRMERGQDSIEGAYVAIEGHGREDEFLGSAVDTSQTVGWFTSIFPIRLGRGCDTTLPQLAIKAVVDSMNKIPCKGIDYAALRYLNQTPGLVSAADPQVLFDYLGRFDLASGIDDWSPIMNTKLLQELPFISEPDFSLRFGLDIIAAIYPTESGPQLVTLLRWSEEIFNSTEVERLTELWHSSISALSNCF
ncbi:MAG: condensation domain-containing protein [Mycobacteriaceae bacterium]